MAKIDDGGPAYPNMTFETGREVGMTLLDYFAAEIKDLPHLGMTPASRSKSRYDEAVAMIAEKRRRETADDA